MRGIELAHCSILRKVYNALYGRQLMLRIFSFFVVIPEMFQDDATFLRGSNSDWKQKVYPVTCKCNVNVTVNIKII